LFVFTYVFLVVLVTRILLSSQSTGENSLARGRNRTPDLSASGIITILPMLMLPYRRYDRTASVYFFTESGMLLSYLLCLAKRGRKKNRCSYFQFQR